MIFALKPDLAFYFRVPIDISMDRILSGRPKLKFYEAGMDMNLSNDIYESYRIFQSKILEQYELMSRKEKFSIIDATLGINEQQTQMRGLVKNLIPPRMIKKDEGGPLK